MRVTKKQYEYFKERVNHWRKELGVLDYSVHFHWQKLDDVFAETRMNNSAHLATIVLNTSIPKEELNDEQINTTAFHEVMHLVLDDLCNEAKARYASEYDIDKAEHAVIRRLENLITGTRQ